jgi:hypothetical protein
MAFCVLSLGTGYSVPPRSLEASLPAPLSENSQNVNDYSCGIIQQSPYQGMPGAACSLTLDSYPETTSHRRPFRS